MKELPRFSARQWTHVDDDRLRTLAKAGASSRAIGVQMNRTEAARHQVQAGVGYSQRLWFSHDVTERGRRADPSQGHAGDPDHGRGVARLDASTLGRGEGAAAAITR
jgi:hypothetical protein